MRWFLIIAICFASPVVAQEVVSQKIDTAIEFAQAGRVDLALQQLAKLLQGTLTSYEKATVLYNSAVLFAAEERFWEALTALNQIDDNMFDEVKKMSPIEAMQIAYDGAIVALGYAKKEIANLDKAAKTGQDVANTTGIALSSAQNYYQRLAALGANVKGAVLAHIQEEISNLSFSLALYQERQPLAHDDKSALLNTLGASLQDQLFSLMDYFLARGQENLPPYMQLIHERDVELTFYCLARVQIFLQAPANQSLASMHAFFAGELKSCEDALKNALSTADLQQAMSKISQLSSLVLLLEAEVTKSETASLLADRLYVASMYSLSSSNDALKAFWLQQFALRSDFARRFLVAEADHASKEHASLLRLLQKRLQQEPEVPSLDRCIDDSEYWKVLNQSEKITFARLATALHGAQKTGYILTITALRDRLQALGKTESSSALEAALTTDSPTLQFQDVMISWYLLLPPDAFGFLFPLVKEECAALQADKKAPSFIARTDFQLLVHLLSLHLKKEGLEWEVYNDLAKKLPAFSAKNKKDIDFFTMSLELGWLEEMITNTQSSIEAITKRVDFGVDFQGKTMGLLRYSQDPEFVSSLELLSKMQGALTHDVVQKLTAIPKRGDKIKQATDLVQQAEDLVPQQNKDLVSMQKIEDLLEQASRILHSLHSQAPQKSQLTQNSNQPMQMQKQALKLNPEISVRLLQEMEKDDRSLETQEVPQATGVQRPW